MKKLVLCVMVMLAANVAVADEVFKLRAGFGLEICSKMADGHFRCATSVSELPEIDVPLTGSDPQSVTGTHSFQISRNGYEFMAAIDIMKMTTAQATRYLIEIRIGSWSDASPTVVTMAPITMMTVLNASSLNNIVLSGETVDLGDPRITPGLVLMSAEQLAPAN